MKSPRPRCYRADAAIYSGIDDSEPVWSGEIKVRASGVKSARAVILHKLADRIEYDERLDPQRRVYRVTRCR